MSINETSVEEETKIEDISNALYWRIEKETERMLKSQLQALGVNIDDHDIISKRCRKVTYQDDDLSLASYEYNGVKILGVRIGEGRMSIEFDVPNLKPIKVETVLDYADKWVVRADKVTQESQGGSE
uniref:Uncharacterized protein n=1 Tax=viral metagenome TaxID=1070528 RepID=A0A6H1ZLZ1_9ZZZZ